MSEQYICKRCVMDISAPEIEFTATGCTFCDLAMANKPEKVPVPSLHSGKKYDVLLGLSGGADSAMCLHYLVEAGYNVFTFSVDNGWNDPKADENIMKLVEGMKVPFYRYVLNLDRFRELQMAFLKAGVKNVEIPTDHILTAAAYELADEYGIKTIISGGNWATESIMPRSWGYQPRDLRHIKAIYRRFTGKKLSELPVMGLLKWNWYKWVKGIEVVNLLDHYEYDRSKSIKLLQEKYGYQNYGEKHCENIFTWWFQNWYLFEKFGIDKRKAHLSSLILSGQMKREEAMREIETNPTYPVLGIERRVMRYPKHSYKDYPTDERLFNFISKCIKYARTQ